MVSFGIIIVTVVQSISVISVIQLNKTASEDVRFGFLEMWHCGAVALTVQDKITAKLCRRSKMPSLDPPCVIQSAMQLA